MKNKKLLSFGGAILFCGLFFSHSQAQNVWSSTNATTTSTGNVGIRTTNPLANLHIHGNQQFSGPPITDRFGNIVTPGIAHGWTSRILLTSTNTGTNVHRGLEMRLSGVDAVIHNQESTGTFTLSAQNTPSILFHTPSQRLFLGNGAAQGSQTWTNRAAINIDHSTENGLYIRAAQQNRYGLFIHSRSNQDALIIESGTGFSTTRNFKVTGEGFVFARRYTTTLNNIPDYVFAPTYNLMSINDLRTYLNTNRHLPNIPSATEMEAEPVDLGELTRLLLEKIEESVLYILELEERIKALENGN